MALTGNKRARRQIQYSTRFATFTGKVRASIPGDSFYDWTADTTACPTGTSTIYESELVSQYFPIGCPASNGESYGNVIIPVGSHQSVISQGDANTKAVDEMTTTGRVVAKTTGTCIPSIFNEVTRYATIAVDNNSFTVNMFFYHSEGEYTDPPLVDFTQEVFMSVKTTDNTFVNITRWVTILSGEFNTVFTESVSNIEMVTITLGAYKYPAPVTIDTLPLILP